MVKVTPNQFERVLKGKTGIIFLKITGSEGMKTFAIAREII